MVRPGRPEPDHRRPPGLPGVARVRRPVRDGRGGAARDRRPAHRAGLAPRVAAAGRRRPPRRRRGRARWPPAGTASRSSRPPPGGSASRRAAPCCWPRAGGRSRGAAAAAGRGARGGRRPRALPTGPGRRVGEPFDLAATLETALSAHARSTWSTCTSRWRRAPPSPRCATRRGVTAATFHRAEPLAGVAFLRPAGGPRPRARRPAHRDDRGGPRGRCSEILPGDYRVIAPGVDAALAGRPRRAGGRPGPGAGGARPRPGRACASRSGVLRDLDLDDDRPGDAARAGRRALAHPRRRPQGAARHRRRGPRRRAGVARAEVLRTAGRIALHRRRPRTPPGPVAARGDGRGLRDAWRRAVAAVEEAVVHGVDALVLPPFTREAWGEAVAELAADPARRAEPGGAARPSAGAPHLGRRGRASSRRLPRRPAAGARAARPTDAGARRPARAARRRARRAGRSWPPAPSAGSASWASRRPAASRPPWRRRAAAPADLAVVVGQEIATRDGVLVGLFLSRDVADGLDARGRRRRRARPGRRW